MLDATDNIATKDFCKSYAEVTRLMARASVTADFLANCGGDPSRLMSACRCAVSTALSTDPGSSSAAETEASEIMITVARPQGRVQEPLPLGVYRARQGLQPI